MKKNIVITILVILVVGLSSYIIYDKVINNEEKKDNDKSVDNVETKKMAKKIDTSKDYVYDAYRNDEYEISKYAIATYTNSILATKEGIAVPFINIDSVAAKKINNEMKVLYDSVNEDINKEKCTDQIMCAKYFLNYNTYYSNDTVSIVVSYDQFGSDIPHPTYLGYVFNLKNGNLLSIDDIANLNNISLNELQEMSKSKIKEYVIDFFEEYINDEFKDYNYIDKSIQEFEKDFSSIGQGKVTTSGYDPFVDGYTNSYNKSGVIYFIDSNGKINLLTNLVIPLRIRKSTQLFTLN